MQFQYFFLRDSATDLALRERGQLLFVLNNVLLSKSAEKSINLLGVILNAID